MCLINYFLEEYIYIMYVRKLTEYRISVTLIVFLINRIICNLYFSKIFLPVRESFKSVISARRRYDLSPVHVLGFLVCIYFDDDSRLIIESLTSEKIHLTG